MNAKQIFGAAMAILLSITLIFGTQVNSASASDMQAGCNGDYDAGEVPIGTINAYAGDVSGANKGKLEELGWLVCDGQEYSAATYEGLYCKIGTFFGTTDNPGYFRVPDLRGRFLRGVDNTTGRDPDAKDRVASAKGGNTGDKVGSYQEDAFESHTHNFQTGGTAGNGKYNTVGIGNDDNIQNGRMQGTGGSETRPKNVYVNWIIKAKDVD